MPSWLEESAYFLRQLGGGPGADPAHAVPRFLIPAIFWIVLALVAGGRWRAGEARRNRLLAIAAALGAARELLLLVVEYGSHRGLLDFGSVLAWYPPLEHAVELVVEVVAAYAFAASFRVSARWLRTYLWAGLGAAAALYLVTAPAWAAFARSALPVAGPRPEFAQHPADLAFRVAGVAVLLPAVAALLLSRGAGPAPVLAAVAFTAFLLDHALMIVNIGTGLRHAQVLAPIRHNLHIWAVPALLGIYWRELVDAVRRGERQLALVLEGSAEGFWDVALPRGRMTLSARGAELLGLPPGAPANEWRGRIHPEDLGVVDTAARALLLGASPGHLELRARTPEGGWRWLGLTGRVVEWSDTGAPTRAAGTLRDLTAARAAEEARREMETRAIRSQKLESLGMLAGGVAHDFSNLLAVVRSNLDHVAGRLPPDDAARDAIQDARMGTERALELTTQLLAYAGRGATRSGPVRLDQLATETVRLVRSTLPSGCLLDLDLPPDLPTTQADATQLRQVLMNVLLNAGQAMNGRTGRLSVRAGTCFHAGGLLPDAVPAEPLPAARYVWIEVEDCGRGMDEATRARIFDPFFTTRPDGRGLGLAVVLGVVRSHGGAVAVRSRPGVGTTFRIYLLATAQPADLPEEPATPVRAASPAPSQRPEGAPVAPGATTAADPVRSDAQRLPRPSGTP